MSRKRRRGAGATVGPGAFGDDADDARRVARAKGGTDRENKTGGLPPPFCPYPKIRGPLLAFIDHFLEFISGREFSDSSSGYLYRGTRLRVSAIAGLARRDGKRAKSDQGYPVPFAKGSSDAVHGGVDRGRCLRLRNTAGSGDPVNQISFVHALS